MQPDHSSYYQKLHRYLQWQTERIRSLELRLDAMAQELEAVKKQERIRIDKIEYNFDQLKVETLEGTLNVGISPSGFDSSGIEDLAVGGKAIVTNTARSESFERIQRNVNTYLLQEIPKELEELQNAHGVELGSQFHEVLVTDMQGQVAPRIEHYIEEMTESPQAVLRPEQEEAITDKVKRDIQAGLHQYLLKQKQEGDPHEHPASGH
ncbi:spore germination protein GerPC [Paenibacillus sp. YYML68]|uniref:spore germination protein GerPC n=1 Tax=Paenibacillus sp. YYML68 TaxID=2909250 RepID=UPI002491FA17|nr:spore germination protein GerPC [Paenibacillus sp. YYML68]